MTPTLDRPRRKRPRSARRGDFNIKPVEAGRITVCCGTHLLGWYGPDALAEVLADLARWAVDPAARDALPWPARCDSWEWRPGETLAVWHDGRVLALVTRPAAGEGVVTRLDHISAP